MKANIQETILICISIYFKYFKYYNIFAVIARIQLEENFFRMKNSVHACSISANYIIITLFIPNGE
jgi:hypothetical protein